MAPPIDFGVFDLVLIFLIALVVPFFVPIITGTITGRMIPGRTASWGLAWCIPLGVANIPTTWLWTGSRVDAWFNSDMFGLYYAWIPVSVLVTVLFLTGIDRLGTLLGRAR